MFPEIRNPRIVLIGVSLELYKSIDNYFPRLEKVFAAFHQELTVAGDIINSTICCSREEVEAARTFGENNDADALVIVTLSYTASLTVTPALLGTSLPVIIWNTQYAEEITPEYCFDNLLMNHTVQGTQDITNVMWQTRFPFAIESGHYQDCTCLKRLAEWLKAAAVRRDAFNIRVLELGGQFKGMGDFEFDQASARRQWGPEVVSAPLDEFAALTNAVTNQEIGHARLDDFNTFNIDPALNETIHNHSIRLELALRQLIERYQADAFTMNFTAISNSGRFITQPFLGINKLMQEGMGYAGEGDSLRAALMASMRQLAGCANFTEIYTIDFNNNRMMMCHMQECNPALARHDRKIRLLRKAFWAPGMCDYAGMHFTLEPGDVTLTTITPTPNGSYAYIAFVADIVDMPPLKNFDIPHWLVTVQRPVGELLNDYSICGGCHHLISMPGDQRSALKKLATLQGFEFKDITHD